MKEISGWGRYPVVRAHEHEAEDLEAASADAALSRGLGRSYGDASLPARGTALCTRCADRILSFDAETGILRAEAGLSLRALNEIFPARGWATPVSPGTQYVTLGGMVASDVHGKNHHVAGCFGEHVRALRMRVGDGRVLEIDDASEPDLFRATLGGMGLTGHVLEVEVQLERIPSCWIRGRTERVQDFDELIAALRSASARSPFAAAWVDTTARGRSLGRGIVTSGRYAEQHEAPAAPPRARERLAVPFDLPGWVMDSWSIQLFNTLWFRTHRGHSGDRIVHPQAFFYPLDGIRHWNRLYGRRGMVQYQCVVPGRDGGGVFRRLLEVVSRMGGASPVSVIKDCGAEGKGTLSFPMAGMSLALDFPYRAEHTQAVVDALNELVIEAGGRIYLSKDALTRRHHFAAMEPRLARWNEVRRKWDPDRRLASALAQRLLDPAP
ncbi:MAG TPA: FAD-binding oxidoreductase [Myxococcota bacterium]|nr:FAD-binding oxidoreductase [Myxococcota bacterium]